jgi:hypothetical protein
MPHVHICLVSEQVQPNLIPLLMDKPEEVCLVLTEQAKGRDAARLKNALKFNLPHVKIISQNELSGLESFKFADAFDLNKIKLLAAALAAHYSDHRYKITVNITGGTKPMSIGFFEVFKNLASARLIYCDTSNDKIDVMGGDSIEQAVALDLPTYLLCQGAQASVIKSDSQDWRDQAAARFSLTTLLAQNAARMGNLLASFNFLAHSAIENGVAKQAAIARGDQRKRAALLVCLNEAQRLRLLKYTWNGDELVVTFSSEDSASYCKGVWLEEWIYAEICAIDEQLEARTHCSVGVKWLATDRDPPPNEFDVIVALFNRLYVIEAKTKKMDDKEEKISDRLAGITKSVSGHFGKILLVSVNRPGRTEMTRLELQKVSCIFGADIASPRQKLMSFLEIAQT